MTPERPAKAHRGVVCAHTRVVVGPTKRSSHLRTSPMISSMPSALETSRCDGDDQEINEPAATERLRAP